MRSARSRSIVGVAGLGQLDHVLPVGRVRDERAHALGVRLLQHEAAAHVGMVRDGHARCRLVGHLGQVGTLHAGLGVVERVEVAGRQRRDRLRADHHARVLDHLEHLRDAVVHVTDEVADGRLLLAEGHLAGGGDLQAHLLLDVGGVHAVASEELAGLEVDEELRHDEQRQTLGACSCALGAGQHQVDDVVRHVVLAGRDEALHALDAPRAVAVVEGLVRPAPTSEPASGSVSTIVAPQRFSMMSSAQRFWSALPRWSRIDANPGPDMNMKRGRVAAQHHLAGGPARGREVHRCRRGARAGQAATTRSP